MDNYILPKRTLTKPTVSEHHKTLDECVSYCACNIMNAATSFHKLHLKVSGTGAYAAHKALNELYDALPGHADSLVEGYQGVVEKLIQYEESSPKILNTVEEGISYIRELYEDVSVLQSKIPYSEINNMLDELKSTLASAKYKLLFLK